MPILFSFILRGLTVDKGVLEFDIHSYMSRTKGQYCLELTVNGGTKLSKGFKDIFDYTKETHSADLSTPLIIEAKVKQKNHTVMIEFHVFQLF